MFSFSSVNLGCSKNLVDLEFAVGEILKYSDRIEIVYYDTPENPEVEYVIVNTCGFLSSAREESEETLRYFDTLGKKLILMGCYISVKDDAFLSSLQHLVMIVPFLSYSVIEEILLGKKSRLNISAIIRAKTAKKNTKEKTLGAYLHALEGQSHGRKAFVWKGDEVRAYMHAPFRFEYLKVAEGCDNKCTFCIIPHIRGRQNSRMIEDIIREVAVMFEQGIREIEIIAQDTTRYGTDIYGHASLIELLNAIEGECEKFESDNPHTRVRYRIFYLYPDILTLGHLDHLATLPHFLPYFDIPFQHASERILKLMGRHYDRDSIDSILDYIRTNFPDSYIRTSFIIGFPGETDADFQILLDFIEKYQFESVGLFQYHDEPLAASSRLPSKVDDGVAKLRLVQVGERMEKIYECQKKEKLGKTLQGYIMETGSKKRSYIIRREIQAPEIDEYDQVARDDILTKGKWGRGDFVSYIFR